MLSHGPFMVHVIPFISFVGNDRSPPITEKTLLVPWNSLERGSTVILKLLIAEPFSISLSLVHCVCEVDWPTLGLFFGWTSVSHQPRHGPEHSPQYVQLDHNLQEGQRLYHRIWGKVCEKKKKSKGTYLDSRAHVKGLGKILLHVWHPYDAP